MIDAAAAAAAAADAATYCASSHVTIGERPIFHRRVKKARNVNTMGA